MFGSEHFNNNQYLFITLVNDYSIQTAKFINSAFNLRKEMPHKWTVILWLYLNDVLIFVIVAKAILCNAMIYYKAIFKVTSRSYGPGAYMFFFFS